MSKYFEILYSDLIEAETEGKAIDIFKRKFQSMLLNDNFEDQISILNHIPSFPELYTNEDNLDVSY